MKPSCSGVILAGGLNIRYNGQNKALIQIGRQRIIDNILNVFSQLFEETIVVTNDPLSYSDWDLPIVTDIFPVRSPLTGIHSGLFHATNPYVFFAACDIPFLQKGLIKILIDHVDSRTDVVVPQTEMGLEPLCALYSKMCLPAIEKVLDRQFQPGVSQPDGRKINRSLKIQSFFEKVRVKKVPEEKLRAQDPELVSFFNVNTPEDYEKAMKMLNETKTGRD